MTELFFIVRTDVGPQSGQQRMFDVTETLEEAERRLPGILNHLPRVATLGIYRGVLVEPEPEEEQTDPQDGGEDE